MDYSENIKASLASDFAYAKWYAKQSDERKAGMILSGYRFVVDNIRNAILEKNPFSTKAYIKSKFIEYTQKEDYSEATFAFIQEKMSERSEKEWQDRFKAMKKDLGWSYEQMALYMEAKNGASVKASVNRQLPAFAKLAVCVFEEMNRKKEETESKGVSE